MWRALRSNGVNEYYITGDASDYEKFQKWCETMPYLIGNPLYHWCHLELKKYFGLDLLLNSENCAVIWQHCNQKLSQESHRFQSLLKESRVDTLCTTDDPLSDLSYHDKLNRSEFSVQVLPTFRADSLIEIENQSNFQRHSIHWRSSLTLMSSILQATLKQSRLVWTILPSITVDYLT